MLRLRRALLIAVGVLMLLPASALAGSSATTDCYRHTKLTHRYTIAQLRSALATMPADVKEYTSCYTIIDDQLFLQLGKKPPGTGESSASRSASGGGSFISIPLLVALIVIVLGGVGLTYAAWRRGRGTSPPGDAG